MEILDYPRQQFAYDAWANREVLRAIKAATESARARPLQLMTHILAAKLLWLERLQQQPQTLPVWPEFTLEQWQAQADAIDDLWKKYLDRLTPAGLEATTSYKNSLGQPWTSTAHDVMTHVILHGAYHRGQVATALRASGQTPAYTDFIHAVRQGLIE